MDIDDGTDLPMLPTVGVNTHHGVVGGTQPYARTWCLTVNDEDELESWCLAFYPPQSAEFIERVRYIVWQYEKAPTTGKLHIQAYVEFFKATTMAHCQRILMVPTAHCKKRWGTQAQAISYCSKEDTRAEGPFYYGTPAKQTQEKGATHNRSDIAHAVQVVKLTSVTQLAEEHPVAFVKWHKGLRELEYTLNAKKASTQDRQLLTMCFFGEPGSGKTFTAFNLCRTKEHSYYVLNPPAGSNQSIWFNGYDSQKVLIIDEMSGRWMNWTFLLRLLDKYPLQIQTKGGMTWAQWDIVILTSNSHWKDWFPTFSGGMDLGALERRIHSTIHFYGNESNGTPFKQYKYEDDKDGDEVQAVINQII